LKNGLAISYYKLGSINKDKQQTKLQYQQAIKLFQELYELNHLEKYKKNIEQAKGLF